MTNRSPLPEPTPDTQHFWDGTRAGELRLQRCNDCGKIYFPPRPFCPKCVSRSVSIIAASGRAKLHTYVVSHMAIPDSGIEAPYSVAVVQLEEGPRLLTNIVECEQTPEALQLDMPVEVVFEEVSPEITLANFRPVRT